MKRFLLTRVGLRTLLFRSRRGSRSLRQRLFVGVLAIPGRRPGEILSANRRRVHEARRSASFYVTRNQHVAGFLQLCAPCRKKLKEAEKIDVVEKLLKTYP